MSEKCCQRKKVRSEEEQKLLINRLNRIEGQVRGIKNMVENDVYCIDILTQVSATTSAMNSFGKELLVSHIKNCVVNDIKDGNTEKLDELVEALISKFMK